MHVSPANGLFGWIVTWRRTILTLSTPCLSAKGRARGICSSINHFFQDSSSRDWSRHMSVETLSIVLGEVVILSDSVIEDSLGWDLEMEDYCWRVLPQIIHGQFLQNMG